MADKEVVITEMIGSTMACSFVFLFVALKEDGTAALEHILTVTVEVGTGDALGPAYSYAVV